MKDSATQSTRPSYGLDAPDVVRNLLLVGGALLALSVTAWLGLWSGVFRVGPIGGLVLDFPFGRMGAWMSTGFFGMAAWMVWSSRVGKLQERETLLDRIPWTGAEQVLDVGCGAGLMLIGAAKRLQTGHAVGIDIWKTTDLSGNRAEVTLENARLEGVADRVEVRTADMREIPFPDASFDVVVSCAAIHNVTSPADREKIIGHIVRVLKPGGHALIDDIRHGGEYRKVFAAHGCGNVKSVGSPVSAAFLTLLTMGSLQPTILVARKNS